MNIPYYTDDVDDPHWRCINCGHCKEIKIYKRVLRFEPCTFIGEHGVSIRRSDRAFIIASPTEMEFEDIFFCEASNCETEDTNYCPEFMEKNDDD